MSFQYEGRKINFGGLISGRFASLAKPFGFVILLIFLASSAVYTVDQTELGTVRRFGTVVYPPSGPVEPGIPFKIPFVDVVDKLTATLSILHILSFAVLTVDNQYNFIVR